MAAFSATAILHAVLVTAIATIIAAPVRAAPVFFDDLNDPSFIQSFKQTGVNDRFGPIDVYRLANVNGWSFVGDSVLERSASGDGAILLNETGNPKASATRQVGGLRVGGTYELSFLMSGDDVPPIQVFPYFLDVAIGTGNSAAFGAVTTFSHAISMPAGTEPGKLQSFRFTASDSNILLRFTNPTRGAASPVFDNVALNGVPEPASWAMLIAGFGLVGATSRRHRSRVAA